MKVELNFDLTDERDYSLWSRIAAVLSGSTAPPSTAATTAAPVRQKITPAPQPTETAVAPQPTAGPAPAQAPAAQSASSATAQPAANGEAVPTVQELREMLSQLGSASSAGEAADFLRLKIGAANLSSIPDEKRGWAMQLLKQEIANRAVMA